MHEPFDTRLDEAILAEPEAVEPRRVLADFLEERGHPRAELIRLAIAGDREADALLARHRERFGVLGDGASVEWRLGFADSVTLHDVLAYRIPVAALWPTIATHRSYRFVRALSIVRGDFRFDPVLPPPDGIRMLHLCYDHELVASLARVCMPRVERLELDRHVSTAILDPAVLAPVFDGALPALVDVAVEKCLDEPAASALVALIARSPLGQRLRSLQLARFTESAAQSLLALGRRFALSTQTASVSAATRRELDRLVVWRRGGTSTGRARSTSASPQHAPADFAAMPPVSQIVDSGIYEAVWAGSGVGLPDHPSHASGSGACGGCTGTHTAVIWARSELVQPNAGWSADYQAVTYELVCRACGRFTVYTATGY